MSKKGILSAISDSSTLFSHLVKTQYANPPAYAAPSFNRNAEIEKTLTRLRFAEPKSDQEHKK
jgi:hypothetical protein